MNYFEQSPRAPLTVPAATHENESRIDAAAGALQQMPELRHTFYTTETPPQGADVVPCRIPIEGKLIGELRGLALARLLDARGPRLLGMFVPGRFFPNVQMITVLFLGLVALSMLMAQTDWRGEWQLAVLCGYCRIRCAR